MVLAVECKKVGSTELKLLKVLGWGAGRLASLDAMTDVMLDRAGAQSLRSGFSWISRMVSLLSRLWTIEADALKIRNDILLRALAADKISGSGRDESSWLVILGKSGQW